MKPSAQPGADPAAVAGDPPKPQTRVPARFLRLPADWRSRSAEGFALGALLGLCVSSLGISELLHLEIQEDVVLLPALIGTAIALSPARRLLRAAVCVVLSLTLIVGYTPLMSRLMPPLSHTDRLERVPAIVVISTSLRDDNTL